MIKYISFLLIFFLLFSINTCFAQSNEAEDSFLSLILELKKDAKTNKISATVISEDIHKGKLKSPSRQDQKTANEDNAVVLSFKNLEGKVVKQFVYTNPFLTDYEYVDDVGQLKHVNVPESKKTYHIRLNYEGVIKTYELVNKSEGKFDLLLSQTIKHY